MPPRVRVTTNPAAEDYDVVIEAGILDRLSAYLPEAHSYAIICDDNVAPLYARAVQTQLRNAVAITFNAGEKNKTAATWHQLIDHLIALEAGRDTCIIALGGGVTGDLAGFVAATYMRGLPVVQIPTTLLAMIDASIGGKTGIDIEGGKNLVGAFHQPAIVIIDPNVLRTLPANELRYGLAEAIKHGAIADAAYLDWIREDIALINTLEPQSIMRLIARSVEIKANFVSSDVREAGARAALNFGHTIGHALERVTSYALPHGEAVATGMMVELLAAESHGIAEPGSADLLSTVLAAAGLPVRLPGNLDADRVLEATRTDKKAREGQVRYAIPVRMGEFSAGEKDGWTRALPDDVVREVLRRLSIT